jgi:hypothetical protein
MKHTADLFHTAYCASPKNRYAFRPGHRPSHPAAGITFLCPFESGVAIICSDNGGVQFLIVRMNIVLQYIRNIRIAREEGCPANH